MKFKLMNTAILTAIFVFVLSNNCFSHYGMVIPSDNMITQVIKADQNGIFSYCAPVAGWWGFAALNRSDKKMMHDGEKKDIELGAVIWVKFEAWQEQ